MDFVSFLFLRRRINLGEYTHVLGAQHGDIHRLPKDSSGFLSEDQTTVSDDRAPLGVLPVGEVLLHMPETAERLFGSSDAEAARPALLRLVQEWQEWHRDHLEPICTYSTSTRFGRQMYNNRTEKKLVASFLATAKVRNGMPIVCKNDIVLIPEGSSGAYAGLGIAARPTSRVCIVTSNAALIREYQDNPTLAPRFQEFRVIGGVADGDHGGVHDEAAEQHFVEAIGREPGTTIVIVTVSGLLAQSGPHVDGPMLRVKQRIIRESLVNRGVRELVFVADYSKHVPAADHQDFGAPLFGATDWQQIVKEHRSRICIVTAPPPALRRALELGVGHDVARRNLDLIAADAKIKGEGLTLGDSDRAYDQAAKALRNVAGVSVINNVAHPMFHEAYTFPVPAAPNAGPHGEAVVFHTEDTCQVSGLYRSNGQCGHPAERTIPKGRKFPTCPKCREVATWVLLDPNQDR
jgi:hypothetical protein